MRLKKQLEILQKKVDDLINQLNPVIIAKSKERDELVEQLSHLTMKVSSIVDFVDKNGNTGLKIFYSIEPVELMLEDKKDDFQENKVFKAINFLNLIDLKDMKKIQKRMAEKIE